MDARRSGIGKRDTEGVYTGVYLQLLYNIAAIFVCVCVCGGPRVIYLYCDVGNGTRRHKSQLKMPAKCQKYYYGRGELLWTAEEI